MDRMDRMDRMRKEAARDQRKANAFTTFAVAFPFQRLSGQRERTTLLPLRF
jgi:hypothetical protein